MCSRLICILSTFFLLFATVSLSFAAEPLLQEGKKTLYQRVVSHPGAKLYSSAEPNSSVKGTQLKTFTVFYVYAVSEDRLQVGVSSTTADGWVDKDKATFWNQAVTMLFTDRAGRQPVLFFKDHDSLEATCVHDNLGALIVDYQKAAEIARAGASLDPAVPVVAMEPSDVEGAVSRSRFYLMPVLNMDNQFEATKLIEVASIDPGNLETIKQNQTAGSENSADSDKDLTTAIAFVIDTTISMRPYIENTLKVIRSIYDKLEKSPYGDRVAFAVLAFRNSLDAAPGLEYITKVISDFKTVTDRQSLEQALAEVEEAIKSSHAFDEDSLAGIKSAVDQLFWEKYASRVMLLVTDAGPLASSDKYASVGMQPSEMADYLRANNIWLTVLHIKDPKGAKNHAYAEKAYKSLAKLADGSASYLAIEAKNSSQGVESFTKAGLALADSYAKLAEATATGKLLAKPEVKQLAENPEDRARQLAEINGYAMQLEFLGAKRQNQAPSVVAAWITDADLEKLAENSDVPVMAVEPALLLTKNQLSDLSGQLKLLIEGATKSQRLGGTDFFESLISMAAQLSRDPSRFSHTPGQNLAQSGVLAEFLDGLPYKSDVLNMTEEQWYNKSVGEQVQFINRLKSRIARYEEYDKDRNNWESFGSASPGDWVYRVPLSMLP